MAVPLDVRDMLKHGSQVLKDREKAVQLALVVEPDAPDALIALFREALRPATVNARVRVVIAEPGKVFEPAPQLDAVVALAGSCRAGLLESLEAPRRMRIPVVVAALVPDRAPIAAALEQPMDDTVTGDDLDEILEQVAVWLEDRLPDLRLALAANFAFLRRAVAWDAVKSTAAQNALIGGVTIIPGADMPLMTANQAKMLLQIAAAYGQRIGADRIRELVAVVGGAFALRAVARQVLTFVPGFGWAVKAGIGYTGTLAMGKAAISYFESGADLVDVAGRLTRAGESAAARGASAIRARRDRSLPPGDV